MHNVEHTKEHQLSDQNHSISLEIGKLSKLGWTILLRKRKKTSEKHKRWKTLLEKFLHPQNGTNSIETNYEKDVESSILLNS